MQSLAYYNLLWNGLLDDEHHTCKVSYLKVVFKQRKSNLRSLTKSKSYQK